MAAQARQSTWWAALLAALLLASPAPAQEVIFRAPSADRALEASLRAASLVLMTLREGAVPAGDVVAAARAEYGRLLGALYQAGHYAGLVSVRLDGREAAEIPLLEVPARVARIEITVQPGPPYRFIRAEVAPLAPGSELPEGFAPGAPAPARLIAETVEAAVEAWRDEGHAKAAPAGQSITADHAANTIDARIRLAPGPRLDFGALSIRGNSRVRSERIRTIAGLPEGAVFSPAALRRSAERLRRTGAFRSVTLREAAAPGPDGTLGIEALVEEEAPRRLGFGAELSSTEGLRLESFWLHRNLFGGAERFRIEGEIAGIGGDTGGEDYRVALSLSRPATLSPDTTLDLHAATERLHEPDYDLTSSEAGLGFTHIFSEKLTGTAALNYRDARVEAVAGARNFRTVTLPLGLTRDSRDDPLDPASGFYLHAEAMPFWGLGGSGSGTRVKADARAYRGLGRQDRVVLALRLQYGAVSGASIADTPRDFLFYSGGGGTVRGQAYQSLAVTALPGGQRSGGQVFGGLQSEIRAKLWRRIGIVAFYDIGYIAAETWGDSFAGWHSGAGLGLRYDTGLGPIRFDVAAPLSGGDGVQIYIGIGQSF